jgi:hypothetical protein
VSMHPVIRSVVRNWIDVHPDAEIAEALRDDYWINLFVSQGATAEDIDYAYRKFYPGEILAVGSDSLLVAVEAPKELIQEVDPDLERLLAEEEEIERKIRVAHTVKAVEDTPDLGVSVHQKAHDDEEGLKRHLLEKHDAVFPGMVNFKVLQMYHAGYHKLAIDEGKKPHRKKGKR